MKLTERQTAKIEQIRDAFKEKCTKWDYKIVKFKVKPCKYFVSLVVDINLRGGTYVTNNHYHILIGPRGGIKHAKMTTSVGECDYKKLFRGRIFSDCI